jgi:transcriptional regulator with XRE-family HTH domain
MTNPSFISHDCAAEAFLDAFRRRVGAGAGKVRLADFADAIDMDPRTVKAWHGGETMPNYPNLLKVCAALGPSFASEILHPAGLGGVDQIVPVDVDAQGTATELVKVAHDLLERLADGFFCHVDKAKAAPLLLDLSRMIEAQATAMQAAKP